MRDDEAAAPAELPHEIRDAAVVLVARLDEGLHADVVALLRLREQALDRALELDVGLAAGREHLVRLVLRRLHVGLVERVDLEIDGRDGDRELPAEELAAERVRVRELGPRGLPVGAVG